MAEHQIAKRLVGKSSPIGIAIAGKTDMHPHLKLPVEHGRSWMVEDRVGRIGRRRCKGIDKKCP